MSERILIPKEEWEWRFFSGDRLGMRCYERKDGLLEYAIFNLSELPNDLVSFDDLKRIGFAFDLNNWPSVFQFKIVTQ